VLNKAILSDECYYCIKIKKDNFPVSCNGFFNCASGIWRNFTCRCNDEFVNMFTLIVKVINERDFAKGSNLRLTVAHGFD